MTLWVWVLRLLLLARRGFRASRARRRTWVSRRGGDGARWEKEKTHRAVLLLSGRVDGDDAFGNLGSTVKIAWIVVVSVVDERLREEDHRCLAWSFFYHGVGGASRSSGRQVRRPSLRGRTREPVFVLVPWNDLLDSCDAYAYRGICRQSCQIVLKGILGVRK
jgi:hypothetical protein